MSKEFTKEDVIENKKEAIKALNKLLEYFINDKTKKHLKKAHLISYWVKDYTQMLSYEEKFNPAKNIAYKRGNIVKLNFGFNIGSEYGGLHYGIVLDNKNAHNSPVVTVIPLTSVKDSKDVHFNSVELGNEIYHSLKIKYNTIFKSLKEEQEEIRNTLALFKTFVDLTTQTVHELEECEQNPEEFNKKFSDAQKYLDTSNKLQEMWEKKEQHNKEQREYLEKIGLEISRMKEGSIALVNQITTVSKMRIFDPRNLRGVLAGISLSEENMEKINNKVKDLYVF